MNKILGIFGLLVFVCLFTMVLTDNFNSALNLYNVTRWSSLFGIISIGVAFVIITGGIDLSIGSVVCLAGCLLSILIMDKGWSIYAALAAVMVLSCLLGLLHGVLITKLKLQPFVVTLCGLLFYRGFARWYAADQPQGFGQVHNDGLRQLAIGKPCDFSTFFMLVGGLTALALVAYGTLKFKKKLPCVSTFLWAGFALVLAVVSSSGMWFSGDQIRVLNVAGQRIALEPASLMHWTGLAIFTPAAILFVGLGLRAVPKKTVIALLAVAVAAGAFALVARYEAPKFDKINPGSTDESSVLGLTMQGAYARNLIMGLAFVATGALMGAIGWLASTVASASKHAASDLGVVVFGAVLWMVGMTKLPETMVPMPLLILLACTLVASVFLNQTIYGRYLLALGRNEEAAKYSGINTDRMIILAYVICAAMGGLGAILFAVDINNLQPANHGNIYELYAIAAAVLGGCSLRGGEGSIVGVIIGAAVMRVLYNAINVLGIDTKLEWAIIGIVILAGVIADEVVKRIVAAKRARLQAQNT